MKITDKFAKFLHFLESVSEKDPEIAYIAKKGFAVCFNKLILESVHDEAIKMRIDWNNYPEPMIQDGIRLMKEINSIEPGAESHITGGAVRDIVAELIAKEARGDDSPPDVSPHDVDIATNVDGEALVRHFGEENMDQSTGGEKHGTYLVKYGGIMYEVTLYRAEGEYTDSRRPDFVKFIKSFKEDTARRDLRINSMGIDAEGNVIDYWDGIKDIKERMVRTVGTPGERFDEDPIRMIRAIRFASDEGFRIHEDTYDAIKQNKHLLERESTKPSTELVRDELKKIIHKNGSKKFALALDMFRDTGMASIILPEINMATSKVKAIDRADTKDHRICFAILAIDMSEAEIKAFATRFLKEDDDIKSMLYIKRNLWNYGNLSTIDKSDAYNMIVGRHKSDKNAEYFPLLRKVHIAITGGDIPNAEELISSIVSGGKVASRGKEISTIVGKMGVRGPDFKKVKDKALSWLFTMFDEGKEPSPEELNVKIAKIIEEGN